jgi:hypothetical protein
MIIPYNDKYQASTLELCFEWASQLKELTGFEISKEHILSQFEECEEFTSILIVDGICQGILAGKLTDNTISPAKIWSEVIYYVRPDFRKESKQLFKSAEIMLKSKGIDAMLMILMCNYQQKLIDRLYKGLGFRPLEVQYIKNI